MNHYRKTIHKYKQRKSKSGCPFCDQKTLKSAVAEDEYVYVVKNLTQYDLWEFHKVEDHLMVVPKRHTETISELTSAERLAIMEKVAEYESKGYSVYARGVGFIKKSVKHQHTHLIKVNNKKPKFAIFIESPYYLFRR